MKNIIFSTTRQWNPGDELILAGVMNVLRAVGEQYNPIIFNRNPDVRSCFQDEQMFKTSQVPNDFHVNAATRMLESNLKFGFFDNSLKPNTDCRFADWVIFAGTPEWCNGKTYDLYVNILKYQIPVMILGVGGGLDIYKPHFLEVIQKAKAFVVREETTLKTVRAAGLDAIQLACPALLSAPPALERHVETVRKIGLIFQATQTQSVIWNGCTDEAYLYQMQLCGEMVKKYYNEFEISIICHYIDELPIAKIAFPKFEILYSYDAKDYLEIYRQFDLVIGMRVHGIGAAASVGVPGVALLHSDRSETCHGFLADTIPYESTDIETAMHTIDAAMAGAAVKSAAILEHKATTMDSYKQIVRKALTDPKVEYAGANAPDHRIKAGDLKALANTANLFSAMEREKDRIRLAELEGQVKTLQQKLDEVAHKTAD